MALVQCPECTADISSDSWECPKCGKIIRKPERSIFGKIVKWAFIIFNIIMVIWLIGGVSTATKGIGGMTSIEQAGTAIGTGLGAAVIITIWVLGAFFLGLFVLFTRPQK